MAEILPVYWYVIIAVLWLGYLALEGFDLGVGMLVRFWARDEPRRRVLLNIIGPVWEGNEVWLITAVGAMFAAFPFWYAAVFSTLYLPMLVMLFGLILRAVSIEYRGKAATDAGREIWTWTLGIGSFLAAFMAGVLLVLTTTGLPLDANGDRVGGPFVWVTGPALLGGLAVVGFSLAQAWAFIDALKLHSNLANIGDVRSLVVHPATTTHSQSTEAGLARAGITQATIRLSVGIEDIDDILADLDRGFAAIA